MTLNMEFETDKPFDFEFGDWLMALFSDPSAVKYTPQEDKTAEEKAQARKNIAAAVDVIVSEDNAPTRLIDLPEGIHELTGYFPYNAQSDEEGVVFDKNLVAVTSYEMENSILIQGFKGRLLHAIAVSENSVSHDVKNVFEQTEPALPVGTCDPAPDTRLSAANLSRLYNPSFYTTLPGAVTDLNNNKIGETADATPDKAVCALYTDYAGNACLTLLNDIDLSEAITISTTSTFKVNGYTINYPGDYSIAFEGNNCVFDLQVDGSRLVKDVENVAAMSVMVGFSGSNCQLLGGCINYTAAGASQPLCAVVVKGICSIRNLDTTVELISSDKQVYGIQVATNGNADIVETNVSVKSDSSGCFGVYCLAKSVGCRLSKCEIIAESTTSAAQGCYCASTTYTTVVDECVIHSSASKKAATGIVLTAGVAAKVVNSDIFADGTTGSNNDTVRGASVGISNNGTLDIENCTVFGTQSGICSHSGSTTVINGGTYESCSHGGAYIACTDGNFYAQNATFRNVPYRGKYKNQFNYHGAVYLVAAVYIGGSSTADNIKAYMDNCVLDGGGPELLSQSDGYLGAEPVRFRASGSGDDGGHEENNALYASSCTFMGDGKIRFGNSAHHLYLGFGNRVLCEANLPDCVDTTTYAKKVFTSYEET